jgi:hypothetical protein
MTGAPLGRPVRTPRLPLPASGRLLRLEVRRNAMLWMVPVAAALFWLITYRRSMALPPLWNVRTMSMQTGAVSVFAATVVGVAAWTGSREGRHRPAAVDPSARRVERHHLLGAAGVPGVRGRAVRRHGVAGGLG